MATQSLAFGYTTGQTLTAQLFGVGSDTVAATASSVTEATNRKGRYVAAFTDVAAGDYLLVYFLGGSGAGSEKYTLTLTTATFEPWAEYKPGDATAANQTAILAKVNLITSQTANQSATPANTLTVKRGDSFTGTHTVTTDYTGYTATFTVRHRVTDAVLCTASATVTSSTLLTVNLTTTDTAFALLVDATEFGPHPYDIQLVNGATQKTESGIAIITRDQTRA